MDSSLAETLFVPWWKVILYGLAIAISIVAIRVSIKFDLNEWLNRRREGRLLKERHKIVDQCRHGWTLYPSSPFSTCNGCQAWISTPILLTARQLGDVKPMILAEYQGAVLRSKGGPKGPIVVNDYIGRRD